MWLDARAPHDSSAPPRVALKAALLSLKDRVPLAGRVAHRARLAAALARREVRHAERRAQEVFARASGNRSGGPAQRWSEARSRRHSVRADRLLLGGGGASSPDEPAGRSSDLAGPSTPLPDWPAHLAEDRIPEPPREVVAVAVKRSDCYLVLAGHRAAAIAHAAGAAELDVKVVGRPRWTPFQQVILDMGWLDSRAALYQPIDLPEFESWSVVRACRDRANHMVAFLTEHGPAPGTGASYLDVAACYGWFVAEMLSHGYDARGIELEPVAPVIARTAYDLDPERIAVGDSVVLLQRQEPADVVSCFSLAHHFVLGRGSCSAEELVGLLARRTRRVMFFDMGQDHETWFRHSLAGWNADHVRTWLLRNTDFDDVVALAVDADDRPPYEGNYGRTLFACVRRQA